MYVRFTKRVAGRAYQFASSNGNDGNLGK